MKKPKKTPHLITVPTNKNNLLEKVLDKVNLNLELTTLWRVNNVNAIDRLGFNDHGPIHFQIVSNIGLKLVRMLTKHNIQMSVTKDYGLSQDYAEMIVFLAAVMHDIGMSINREGHEELSLFLANDLLKDILGFLPLVERTIIKSEVLHAILSHRHYGKPQTFEAGIIRIADALDMNKGRSRIPYEAGQVNIHSVSANAIEDVEIVDGTQKPIEINILMSNYAGIYQVDELLRSKFLNSGIEQYFDIRAYLHDKSSKSLIKEFSIN